MLTKGLVQTCKVCTFTCTSMHTEYIDACHVWNTKKCPVWDIIQLQKFRKYNFTNKIEKMLLCDSMWSCLWFMLTVCGPPPKNNAWERLFLPNALPILIPPLLSSQSCNSRDNPPPQLPSSTCKIGKLFFGGRVYKALMMGREEERGFLKNYLFKLLQSKCLFAERMTFYLFVFCTPPFSSKEISHPHYKQEQYLPATVKKLTRAWMLHSSLFCFILVQIRSPRKP